MIRIEIGKIADAVKRGRMRNKVSQEELAARTGINRAVISRIEHGSFTPSLSQLEALSIALDFSLEDIVSDHSDDFVNGAVKSESCRIAVAGLGYVGLSLAVLLSQKNSVTAIDVVEEKVHKVNDRISPILDAEIEQFLKEKELDLCATTNSEFAYKDAEFVIVAAPTNYDSQKNFFDTSAVEKVVDTVLGINPDAVIVIKSTVPVGFTENIRKRKQGARILFSPEFLRESRALYDNLHPSRIIVGTDRSDSYLKVEAERFAAVLLSCSLEKDTPILIMGSTEAEAVKLFSNTYLALRVSYFNELDTYAEVKNLDTKQIMNGV